MERRRSRSDRWVVSEIRGMHCADLDPLQVSQPPDAAHFRIYIEVTVGESGEPGGDIFGVTVCTPSWLADTLRPGEYLFPRHHLIVQRYDYSLIRRALHDMFNGVQGKTWSEVTQKLARWGYWEFEDFR